jgi:hypothetical protein
MAIYDDMIEKLPSVMRQENVLKYYSAISELFEDFDNQLVIFENVHLIKSATGEWLDKLGTYVQVARNGNNDEDYRARISFEYFRFYFAPTLTNLLTFVKQFSGFYPTRIEGQNFNITWSSYFDSTWAQLLGFTWEDIQGFTSNEPAYLKFVFGSEKVWNDYLATTWGSHETKTWEQFGYVFDPDFDPSFIENIDKIAGAGVKLETDY